MKTAFLTTALALAIGGTAFAGDMTAPTTDTAPAGPVLLADAEMDGIVAGNHVIRLVLQQSGKDAMPTEAARAATDRAGSIDGAGKDRPAILKLLN